MRKLKLVRKLKLNPVFLRLQRIRELRKLHGWSWHVATVAARYYERGNYDELMAREDLTPRQKEEIVRWR